MSRNLIILEGNLGKDIEFKSFENGGTIAEAVLATSEKYKDRQGQLVEKTEWHNLKFPKVSDAFKSVLEKTGKGCRMSVSGKMSYRQYEDQQGNKRTFPEVLVFDVNIIDYKDSKGNEEVPY